MIPRHLILMLLGLQGAACQSGPPSNPGVVVPVATVSASEVGPGAVAPGASSASPSTNGSGLTNTPGAAVQTALQATVGSEVTLSGLYLGWSGPCKGQPPSRSAWQIADEAAAGAPCLYVDGSSPRGVSPLSNTGSPRKVKVRGVVKEAGGIRYLLGHEAVLE